MKMRMFSALLLMANFCIYGEVLHWESEQKNCFVNIDIVKNFTSIARNFTINISSKSENSSLDLSSIFPYELPFPNVHDNIDSSIIFNDKSIANDGSSISVTYEASATRSGKIFFTLSPITFVSESHSIKFSPTIFEVDVPQLDQEVSIKELPGIVQNINEEELSISKYNEQELMKKLETNSEENAQKLENFLKKKAIVEKILLASLALLAIKGIKKLLSKKSPKREIIKKESPRETALKAIAEITNLPKQERFEEFYILLTNVVREYLEKQYEIKATEQTTEEFLVDLSHNSKISCEISSLLKNFLSYADLVKFAKHNPSQEDCDNAENGAKKIINYHLDDVFMQEKGNL